MFETPEIYIAFPSMSFHFLWLIVAYFVVGLFMARKGYWMVKRYNARHDDECPPALAAFGYFIFWIIIMPVYYIILFITIENKK